MVIAITVVIVVTLLCFKGIKINFNKTFTINDNRAMLTTEQTQGLEKQLNPEKVETKDKSKTVKAGSPMDTVLETIASVFGPEEKPEEDK